MARQAHLRSEPGAEAREEDTRAAQVYPFPKYAERQGAYIRGQTVPAERRTVYIKGQTVPPPRRRRPVYASRTSARPDRIAMWAVLLGLVMIAIAAATAHAAPVHPHAAPAAHVAQLR